jgi:murein DD-endopeptidase MepM/ murein hydrolase activator NlpD
MEVHWWIGIVESKNDPEARGRVQVRILGIHTNEFYKQEKKGIGIPTQDLPWATCSLPLSYGGSIGSTVSPVAVMPGTWVMGVSLDGDAYQKLVVLGVISMAMSLESLHNGADLSQSVSEEEPEEEIEEMDTCEKSYEKALSSIEKRYKDKMADNVLFVLQKIKESDASKYQKFLNSVGISESSLNKSESQNALKFGYFKYCLNKCKDPVLAALAYKCGFTKAIGGSSDEESFIKKYGDPRKKEISYSDLAKQISTEDSEASKFMTDFINSLGESCMNRCVYGISSPTSNTTSVQPSFNDTSASKNNVVVSNNTSKQYSFDKVALPTDSNVITSTYKSDNRPDYAKSKAGEHGGIDLRAAKNAPIYAIADGIVCQTQPSWNSIIIDHGNNVKTVYGHLTKCLVNVGDRVFCGQKIGTSGNTGLSKSHPHLHFEVLVGLNGYIGNGRSRLPYTIDPEKFFSENGISTVRKAGA